MERMSDYYFIGPFSFLSNFVNITNGKRSFVGSRQIGSNTNNARNYIGGGAEFLCRAILADN